MIERLDLQRLRDQLQGSPLSAWADSLNEQIAAKLAIGHGDLPRWQAALQSLPALSPERVELSERFALHGTLSHADSVALEEGLRGLMPWRKGPLQFFDCLVDCEWRSDWKWQRVAAHLDLRGKRVLDVGCGNGYYLWRMLGAGADAVIGIDPNWLFLCQFLAARQYLAELPAWHLPLALEELPGKLEGFDTVFSMGVLYHRRSPIDHLLELKDCLQRGGQLVLETLVVEGDEQQVLVPEDRYAQMRNVWFLPSVPALQRWLRRAGLVDVQCVDVSQTTVAEQRATDWMRFQSLGDFLDPDNPDLTCEGLPAPRRAVLLARKP